MYYLRFSDQEDINVFCSTMGKEQVIYAGSSDQVHFYSIDSNLFFVLPNDEAVDFVKDNVLILQEDLGEMLHGWPDGVGVIVRTKKQARGIRDIIETCNPFSFVVQEDPDRKKKRGSKKRKGIILNVVSGCSLEEWGQRDMNRKKKNYSYVDFKDMAGLLISPYRLLKLGRHQYDSADSVFAQIMEVVNVWASAQGLKVDAPEDFDQDKYYGIYLYVTPGKIKVIFEEKVENSSNAYSELVQAADFLKEPVRYFKLYRRL